MQGCRASVTFSIIFDAVHLVYRIVSFSGNGFHMSLKDMQCRICYAAYSNSNWLATNCSGLKSLGFIASSKAVILMNYPWAENLADFWFD